MAEQRNNYDSHKPYKRGSTQLSCVLALDKPSGMTSHDVVNMVRKTLGEKRVGHAGTLDPLASGVLLVCVGPAARLTNYFTLHDKTYDMAIELGSATTTDDAEGEIIAQGPIKHEHFSDEFAQAKLSTLVGTHQQIPPAYSAIKVQGQKAYDAARKGTIIALDPRPIEIYTSQLRAIDQRINDAGMKIPLWKVRMRVSKGTYMRSIARDLGNSLGCFAHVAELRRVAVGSLSLRHCQTLEQFKQRPQSACVDPLQLLGVRYAFAKSDASIHRLNNGQPLAREALVLNEPITADIFSAECCTTSVVASDKPVRDQELVGVLVRNCLKGLYRYNAQTQMYRSECILSLGAERGTGL